MQVDHLQVVAADAHGIADVQFLHIALIEGVAGEADEHQHDAHVHQIAAVAARIAVRQFDHGAQQVHAGLAGDGARAFVELR